MPNVLDVLNAHQFSITEQDETDMDLVMESLFTTGIDYADLAKRTCLCGVRTNGVDEAHDHLRDMIERTIQ